MSPLIWQRLQLKPGERIAIFTDGFLESAVDQQSRKDLAAQMRAAIEETSELPLHRASRLIMQQFDEIAGQPPRDDTTFILLQPKTSTTEGSDA